jgi:RNA polymerase sigma-70 factor (ECF subfamily)
MENARNHNKIFNEWVTQYSDKMYSWAYHKTSNKELAEDLVQETFLSAFKSFDNFKKESTPKTWLFTILNNKIIDYYRKSSRSKQVEVLSIEQSDNLFDSNNNWLDKNYLNWGDELHLLDNTEFINILKNCIAHLPFNWRVAIESKYQSNRKANEICKELNITPSNYWQVIHRAKLQLRICIEQKWVI